MNITPCSQALKDSIKVIGGQSNKPPSRQLTFGFNQFLAPTNNSKFFLPLLNL